MLLFMLKKPQLKKDIPTDLKKKEKKWMLHYTPQFSGRNDKNNFVVIHLRWIATAFRLTWYTYSTMFSLFTNFDKKKKIGLTN